ncbi:MAG: hypothetical protein KY469_02435 [Actinobacteria bacterium]|nr:hypothetical protein [Actinomycetota bacterium]
MTAEMISRLQHEDRLRDADATRPLHPIRVRRQRVRLRVGSWMIRVGERLTVSEHRYETAT